MFKRLVFVASAVMVLIIQEHATELATVTRLGDGQTNHPKLDPRIGLNIQGPSMIRVPDWVNDPLGKYYLQKSPGKALTNHL